jgi:hypothetical protein
MYPYTYFHNFIINFLSSQDRIRTYTMFYICSPCGLYGYLHLTLYFYYLASSQLRNLTNYI